MANSHLMNPVAQRESLVLHRNPRVRAEGRRLTWLMRLASCRLVGFGQASLKDADEPSQLKQAARESYRVEDTAAARSHLQSLLEHYRGTTGNGSAVRSRYMWSQRIAEVAHEYLREGQLLDAMRVLGEAADLQLPPHDDFDDGLASAAAALYRRLAALDADERFEVLHDWSVPTESRRHVRVLTSITPTSSPPKVFARVLGERIRRDSFSPPKTGELRGLFSTAWELVRAADEAGRLRRLSGELFAKKAQEFYAIDNDTIRELKTQKRLISVDIAGARARIAACEKLLPSSRLRGPKAIEQVESIKITAEIDLVDLTAREEAIAKIIDEGTEHKRLIGHSRMHASYYSTESEYIRRAIAAIKELDAKRKLNMPVSVNDNTIQIQPITWEPARTESGRR